MADSPQVTALGNGRYRIEDDGNSDLAYAVATDNSTWVHLDGRVYLVEAAAQRRVGGRRGDENWALSAPMPATVAAINVEPGEQVAEGHVMIMLEAMKMELPVKAPRAGRVRSVLCRPGELVQPGAPLLELE